MLASLGFLSDDDPILYGHTSSNGLNRPMPSEVTTAEISREDEAQQHTYERHQNRLRDRSQDQPPQLTRIAVRMEYAE